MVCSLQKSCVLRCRCRCEYCVGATAVDLVDGEVEVLVCGGHLVDTSSPTHPDRPHVITYQAQDKQGNVAQTMYRFVVVACPEGEVICYPDNDQGGESDMLHCSHMGQCDQGFSGAPNTLTTAKRVMTTPTQTTSETQGECKEHWSMMQ